MMCCCITSRPFINGKVEEKTAGDGPSLATMFEDDRHLQGIIQSIKVRNLSLLLIDYDWLTSTFWKIRCMVWFLPNNRNIFTYSSNVPITYVTAPVSVWFEGTVVKLHFRTFFFLFVFSGCHLISIWLCLAICQYLWTLSPVLPREWEFGSGGHQTGRTQ